MYKFESHSNPQDLRKAKELMEQLFNILQEKGIKDNAIYANHYLMLAQILEQEMVTTSSNDYEDHRIKSGHYYQQAFKLNPNLEVKIFKKLKSIIKFVVAFFFNFKDITRHSFVKLFNLFKLQDVSNIIRVNVLEILTSKVAEIDFRALRWRPIVSTLCIEGAK